ncbi:MAG: Mut7-C RNAse domain-containing protein [Candidatus Nezhaarchaeota archaeon]|nr:Mut7-C RNAse domain-containing protein [Candidatus Nezhaarchaeota archaeon]
MKRKLILDSMCGRLARWLRFLGFDVLYLREADDDVLLSTASETGRVLVTRDEELYERAVKNGIESILLTSVDHVENMSQVLRGLEADVALPPEETRCPLCNSPLLEVGPAEALNFLPSREIARRYGKFWLCDKCGKAYWMGSHWRNIEKILSEVRRNIRER